MSKPDKKTIRAWVDNSSLAEVLIETSKELYPAQPLTEFVVESCIKASDLIEELEDKILAVYDKAYEKGWDDGEKDAEENFEQQDEEEIGLQFAVERFKDCRTLEDFQNEYKWLESMAMTYMR